MYHYRMGLGLIALTKGSTTLGISTIWECSTIANIRNVYKWLERSEPRALLNSLILSSFVMYLHLSSWFIHLVFATSISFHRLANREWRITSRAGPYGFDNPIFWYIILLSTTSALTKYMHRVYHYPIGLLYSLVPLVRLCEL